MVRITGIVFLLIFNLTSTSNAQVFKKNDICTDHFEKVFKTQWGTKLWFGCTDDAGEVAFRIGMIVSHFSSGNVFSVEVNLPDQVSYDRTTKLTFHLSNGAKLTLLATIFDVNKNRVYSDIIKFRLDLNNEKKLLSDLGQGFTRVDLHLDQSNTITANFESSNQKIWSNFIIPCLLQLEE
ncbi:MAG: hypothetical protein H6601_12430 [Flavobacteriales bacterium]|nr:hypothetical protein [Flavobacteriales bacterium]